MDFRHFLERHGLAHKIFNKVSTWLSEAGVLVKEGTLLDATIIEAPSSTKNKDGERDPEMHQTKKGNQWHFGFTKARYRGLMKNDGKLAMLFALANLVQVDHMLRT